MCYKSRDGQWGRLLVLSTESPPSTESKANKLIKGTVLPIAKQDKSQLAASEPMKWEACGQFDLQIDSLPIAVGRSEPNTAKELLLKMQLRAMEGVSGRE